MIFTVFCYGDGDFLFHIFNAVAAMVNHDDFHYALMVVVSYVSLYVLVALTRKAKPIGTWATIWT